MINYIRTLKVVLIILMVSLVTVGMSLTTYVIWKDDNSCNKVIFLKGELSRDINRVDYIANGMVARLHYCDGTSEDVPTSRIIKVVNK
jgi:hypothetical protein